VRLAPTHRLGEIEGSIVAPSREPFKTPLDQPFQAVSEVVAAEKLAAVDDAARKVFDLRDLLDEAIARNGRARPAKYVYRPYRHDGLAVMSLSEGLVAQPRASS
jgi:hypothetical protein